MVCPTTKSVAATPKICRSYNLLITRKPVCIWSWHARRVPAQDGAFPGSTPRNVGIQEILCGASRLDMQTSSFEQYKRWPHFQRITAEDTSSCCTPLDRQASEPLLLSTVGLELFLVYLDACGEQTCKCDGDKAIRRSLQSEQAYEVPVDRFRVFLMASKSSLRRRTSNSNHEWKVKARKNGGEVSELPSSSKSTIQT